MEISEVAMPNQQVLVNAGAKAVADQAVGNAFTVETSISTTHLPCLKKYQHEH